MGVYKECVPIHRFTHYSEGQLRILGMLRKNYMEEHDAERERIKRI